MSAAISLDRVSGDIPDQIKFSEETGFLSTAMKTHQTTNVIIQALKRYFRDKFYLPLNSQPTEDSKSTEDANSTEDTLSNDERFYRDSALYAKQFTAMLAGKNPDLDGTFPFLEEVRDSFTVRDIPVEICHGNTSTTFETRIIESKHEIEGKRLRLILFSFANHQTKTPNSLTPWDPMHTDELSGAVLDVLKSYQQHVRVDSMMCFSLGSVAYDGLKHVSHEQSGFIPKTLILNRGLSSIEKVAQQLYPRLWSVLYKVVCYLGLDANPERELLDFFQRMQKQGAPLDNRKVVTIEARNDRYFSGAGKFDENFHSDLEETGVSSYRGNFFMPMIAEASHHAIRLDWIVNNHEAGTETTNFLPFPKNQTLATCLANTILKDTEEDGFHNSLFVAGSKDDLNSLTYLQAAPLLQAYIKR